MAALTGPAAYCHLSIEVWNDGTAHLEATGCVMDPDGSLQSMGGSYQFSVGVQLIPGMTPDEVKAAIGQAIADGYGGSAPDVVLVPSF
jgi:hypothetical protein